MVTRCSQVAATPKSPLLDALSPSQLTSADARMRSSERGFGHMIL